MFWRVAVPAVFGPLLVAAAARRQLSSEESEQMPGSDHSFETVGPCTPVRTFRDSLLVKSITPAENGSCVLRLTMTAPAEGCGSFPGPHPVVVFLNGFQMRASFYRAYAARLASWGFTLIQYDVPFLTTLPDTPELEWLNQILDWAAQQSQTSGSDLHGLFDLEHVACVGHSRGGKLAALQFAGNPRVKAAYLIDPVDNVARVSPEGPLYPNAAKALTACGRRIGIAGASILGSCNPAGSNWKELYAAVADGSWLTVVQGAAHGTFLDAGFPLNFVFDRLCHRGSASRHDVLHRSLPGMLAWLDLHLRPSPANLQAPAAEPTLVNSTEGQSSLQHQFQDWVGLEVERQLLDFRVKSSNPAHASA
ncbi:hypothetical protein WJX74_004164 [Apatococcus lobatus]|uniref:Chlorophyllase n=2 Tax=Apatococcus TaxID=904362 RepID=A0AAW1S3Y1_9CHLO